VLVRGLLVYGELVAGDGEALLPPHLTQVTPQTQD
jgi:hypothetical protein